MQSVLLIVLALIGVVFSCLVYLLHKAKRQSQPPVLVDVIDRLASNPFISRRALRNMQRRRETSEALAKAAPSEHEMQPVRRAASGNIDRVALKSACLGLLEEVALPHPAGHGKGFARYIIRTQEGERVELMFEKGEKGLANLWLNRAHADELLNSNLECRHFPAAAIYDGDNTDKKPNHGRHASLKSMRELANADLVRFTLTSRVQMQMIVDHLAKK